MIVSTYTRSARSKFEIFPLLVKLIANISSELKAKATSANIVFNNER